ncbi:hypothetical protein CMI46_03280 [Candidatus Pacearchaeota archaeon]|nr:hypothetical protein [Candidatus Pacearchaeota archaeon]|tara:strand:+ start:41 stop:1444 length:1404 start_codon:yes stop_codon:yes gene_type:complete
MSSKRSKGSPKDEKIIWNKQTKLKKEIHYENFSEGIEKFYFWVTEFMENTLHYELEKIQDTSFASVGSAQWGLIEQRKSIQQEKAAQYMGTIGNMTKSMLSIYKELKILDERIDYYTEADKGSVAAEIALKSLWIDLVEGGAKQPTSVLGLASQVGFVTLPDLFFNITPKDEKSVDKAVDNAKIQTNTQVKNILKRKLKQYMTWRTRTKEELATRRYFNIKYLAQHFNVIKMYADWAKPYLQNIGKLNQNVQEKYSHQLLEGSESAVADIEIMGVRKIKERDSDFEHVFPVMLVKFHHRTRPVSAYQSEQHRGSLHIGRVDITFTPYLANQAGIDKYNEGKKTETLKLLKTVDASLSALLDSPDSKVEFEGYLKEAEGIEDKQKEDEKKVKGPSSFGGFEIFIPEYFKKDAKERRAKVKSGKSKTVASKKKKEDASNEEALVRIIAKEDVETIFKTFKVVHGMLVRT